MLIKYNLCPKIRSSVDGNILNCEIKTPKSVLVNSFNEKSAKEFRKDFSEALETGQEVVPVIIDSFGGYVYSLLSMIDTIRNSPVPVATVITGKAMSCGAVLFTCGSQGMRYISKEATLMIHDVSAGAFGKVGEMEVSVDEAKRLNKRIYEIMEENIGKKKGYIWNVVEKKNRDDWYMDAKEALKHNIATHIGVPSLVMKVSVKTSFGLDK